MPDPAHAIAVDRLCKRYGSLLAVNEVSFTVNKGEVFAFLGPNGAGKSTTVEIIETIRAPTSGSVTVFGMDVTRNKPDVVRRIGVLPQSFNSFERITVRETIRYYAQLFGGTADIDALMDLANLRDKADAQFKTLSGGLKQRLGIAIALVNDPELVFLDEPTTGLDPHARREVWDVLRGLKQRGKTVFLTTHYMEEAETLADTVAIISKGRIVAIDSPSRLTEHHTEHLRLTVKIADKKAIAMIQAMGYRVDVTADDQVRVAVTSVDDVRRVLGEFERAGQPVQSIDVRKPNLEEVFLKLTGEPLESDGPSNKEGRS